MGILVFLFIVLVLFLLWVYVLVAWWKLFTKAGRPGWASIVPFYNLYVLLRVVGRPGWWLVLLSCRWCSSSSSSSSSSS